MRELYTIGYEGASVESLIETLENLNIEVLADVRELPLSRKKGLSKNALAENLRQAGIEYRHFKHLGDPKPGRDAAKSGNFEKFEQIFNAHIVTDEAQLALNELLQIAGNKKTCMLCFERCAVHCHRSIIADHASEAGFEVFNLIPDCPHKYLENDFTIPRHNPRKSLTAAE